MRLIEHLQVVARVYCDARKLSVSRVSTLVFGDGQKLGSVLGSGADLTTARFEKTMQWFADNWPEGAEWPESVPDPRLTLSAPAPEAAE